MNLLKRYKWIKCLNEAWQSPLNPIEQVIGMIKRHYYKNKIMIGANPMLDENGKN